MKVDRTRREMILDVITVAVCIVIAFIWPNPINLIGLGMALGGLLHIYVTEPLKALKEKDERI